MPSIEQNQILYIFALDTSLSMKSKKDELKQFHWFKESIEYLIKEDVLIEKGELTTELNKFSLFNAAKVRLIETMYDLTKNKSQASNSNDLFAIWSIGTASDMTYPDLRTPSPEGETSDHHAELTKRNIIHSLNNFVHTVPKDKNSDFNDLLSEIRNKYSHFIIDKKTDSTDSTQTIMVSEKGGHKLVVLTIISDMRHDVKGKIRTMGELRKNWEQLEEKIMELASCNIMANLILPSRTGSMDSSFPNHFQIVPVFNDTLNWYQIQKNVIDEMVNPLLQPVLIERPLVFYYENANADVINPIKISIPEEDTLSIHIPNKVNGLDQHLRLSVEVRGNKNSHRDSRIIFSTGHKFKPIVKKDQDLVISFMDTIPSSRKQHFLDIDSLKHKRTYRFKIHFKQVLPVLISWIFILLLLTILFHPFIFIVKISKFIHAKVKPNLHLNKLLDYKRPKVISAAEGLQSILKGNSSRDALIGKWSGGRELLQFFEDGNFSRRFKFRGKMESGKYKVDDGTLVLIYETTPKKSYDHGIIDNNLYIIRSNDVLVYTKHSSNNMHLLEKQKKAS